MRYDSNNTKNSVWYIAVLSCTLDLEQYELQDPESQFTLKISHSTTDVMFSVVY